MLYVSGQMEFALDRYGIRAIRVVGEDGTNSQWIGDQRVNGIYGKSNTCLEECVCIESRASNMYMM